jgi:hypothetical protein
MTTTTNTTTNDDQKINDQKRDALFAGILAMLEPHLAEGGALAGCTAAAPAGFCLNVDDEHGHDLVRVTWEVRGHSYFSHKTARVTVQQRDAFLAASRPRIFTVLDVGKIGAAVITDAIQSRVRHRAARASHAADKALVAQVKAIIVHHRAADRVTIEIPRGRPGRVVLGLVYNKIVCWPDEARSALEALASWVEVSNTLGQTRAPAPLEDV